MNQYIEAYKAEKVAKIEQNKAKQAVFNIAYNSAIVSGRDKDIENTKLRTITDMLYNDILKDYRNITIKEVEEAFRIGSRGGFGEVYSLSVATFVKWIKAYLNLAERKQAISQYQYAQVNPNNHEPTEIEKKQIELEFIRTIIDRYKQFGKFELYCPAQVAYDAFIRYGMTPLTEQLEKRYRFQAETRVMSAVANKAVQARQAMERSTFNELKQQMTAMEDNGQFSADLLKREMMLMHIELYVKSRAK